MKNKEYKAYVVNEEEHNYIGKITKKKIDSLQEGELLVKVYYSSLNYKDALSASGNKGVTKEYPHTPGIDAAGVVVSSKDKSFSIDDKVIVTSYDLGMNTNGGFAEYIQVPSKWALKLPEKLSMKEAMIFGTAGLTAGISVLRLTELVKPEEGSIIVSGATGGVGSLSIAILNKLGYSVTAITGKEIEEKYLLELGANEIILRKDFEGLDKKPLLKPLYAGAIDTVGGLILENIIKSIKQNGAVTCCGNVASAKLDLTVFPFILRGVTLIGVDSQNLPMISREKVWEKLASDWKPLSLLDSYDEISLDDIDQKISLMLQGKLKGRTIINVNKKA
ncbi:MAG: YhdH/YhfP family quinone oxidoreductase [Spirochaetales bacterium]|uniref:YhdH/YhfP family quinone oxidoreductase n=1 Tax=Candidatus Thalassospirochaeta sargassi TaxID=3119039 RepID=A0AAJ1IFI3_9SPIO|nr:YhdH/YhfP family quinone oxidoreductase [Spirochaetales bacterium]